MLLRIKREFVERSKELLPGLEGDVVDAAEILEDPGWLMARLPGENAWPKPYTPGFGWRPEVFERPSNRVEIASCGYALSHYAAHDFIGVIVTNAKSIERLEEADRLLDCVESFAKPGDSYDEWRGAGGAALPEKFARALYDCDMTPLGDPDIGIHKDVVYPEELCPKFAAITYFTKTLVMRDASFSQARENIERFVSALSVKAEDAPDFLDVDYWHGDGNPWHSIPWWLT